MSALIFPYSFHKGKSLPIIPIGLKGAATWLRLNAYVDSGAFYSIFDHTICEPLGFEVSSGKKMTAVVGNGNMMPFYLHRVRVQLGNDRFDMEVGFSKSLRVGFNLLGLDIFTRYLVIFDGRKKLLQLRRY